MNFECKGYNHIYFIIDPHNDEEFKKALQQHGQIDAIAQQNWSTTILTCTYWIWVTT